MAVNMDNVHHRCTSSPPNPCIVSYAGCQYDPLSVSPFYMLISKPSGPNLAALSVPLGGVDVSNEATKSVFWRLAS
jgi:hypothetical protein